MVHDKARLPALAGCAMSVLMIAGCGAREPVEAPPSTIESGYGATETPELMGAPSAEATPSDGLLGGPPSAETAPVPAATDNPDLRTWRRADGTLVTAMAPIANPESSHPSERLTPRASAAPTRPTVVVSPPVARPVAKPVVAAKPTPKPSPVAKPAPRAVAVAPAPVPLKPVVAAQPARLPAKAPIVAPAKPVPAGSQTKLQMLQTAVASEATKGATLATAHSLTQGKEGQVTLALPATLGDLIKTEAAKLGLGKAAEKTSAYADLQGRGYEITPNGRQTAMVKPGQPATFAWQVKPTPAAKGPLTTEFGAEMSGTQPTQGFTLGSIAKQVAPIQEAAKEKTKDFKFAAPNLGRFETVDLPGVGAVPGRSLLGGALVLLALLILGAISRDASAAKARTERRGKFRAQTDHGRNAMELDAPKAAEVNAVNPMVAAAGGALAGAVVADAVNRHGDHGHGRDEHNPFGTPIHPGEQGQAPVEPSRHDAPAHDKRAADKELEPTH